MKLLFTTAFSALALQTLGITLKLKNDKNIRGDGSLDDELLIPDTYNFRDASDGGSCPFFTRADAYTTLKTNLYDFRSATKVKLSETGSVSVPIGSNKKNRALRFRKRKFKYADINGYDGTVTLRNPARTEDDVKINVMKHDWDGGVFLCQRCTDRSYLTYMFGNRRNKKGGFYATTAFIFTFLYHSDGAGCPSDVGNSFQVVVLFGTRGKSKIAINYGPTNTANALPEMGFWDRRNSVTTLLKDIDGSAIDDITDVSENTYLVTDWYMGSNNLKIAGSKPLIAPPNGDNLGSSSQSCGNMRHCVCNDIVDELDNVRFIDPVTKAQITTGEAVDTHFSFKGRCGRSSTSMATAGYGGRGHICWVKPKSIQCTNDGNNSMKLWHRISIEGENYDVPGYTFTCSQPQGSSGKPYWQRSISKTETKLIIRVKDGGKRKKRGVRPKWAVEKRRRQQAYKKEQESSRAASYCNRDEDSNEFCDMSMPTERQIHIREKTDANVMCRMYCAHPNTWASNVNFGKYVNVDFQRGGTWKCWWTSIDAAGNTVNSESDGTGDVPEGAWCKLQCPGGGGDPDTTEIHCNTWNFPRGFGQYDRDEVKVLGNFFQDVGWNC